MNISHIWRSLSLPVSKCFQRVSFVALLGCWHPVAQVFAGPPELPPLTTVSGSPRLPGKFVWADLVTDDPAAINFYQGLFGWRFRFIGDYAVGMNDQTPICGIFQRSRPKERDAHPRWFGYISVPNVKRAQNAVTKLGGRVLAAPKKVPRRGEQAVFADPEGAVFGVVKSSSGDPEDFKAQPGDWVWIQLLSRDSRKAAEFYKQVAGYDIVANTESNRLSDYVLTSEGYARATLRTIPKDHTQVNPTWLPYVRVNSMPEAITRTERLGGKVLVKPDPQRLSGKVAVISDPAGAAIGLLEWSDDLLKGGK